MTNNRVVIRRPRQSGRSEIERTIVKLVSGIRNGKVVLVLQDGDVIQINREETIKISTNTV